MSLNPIQLKIFNRCLEIKPEWKSNQESLKNVIKLAKIDDDGFKQVVIKGQTYLVPLEDIICVGIKAQEVPFKYKKLNTPC